MNNGRQMLFVLGMHRSGTSALTGVLTILGAPKPATPMADQEENAKGFFESIPVMEVNDAMLDVGDAAWDDWGMVGLPEERRADFREQIRAVLEREFGSAEFVALKDPRICRLFPQWKEAAKSAGYASYAILPYRHPLEVAESLHVRNGLSIAEGVLLWLRYVLDAEYASRDVPRAFVTMADLLDDWRMCLQGVAGTLGIDWPVSIDAATPEIDAFLDSGMRHQRHFTDTLATHPLLIGWAASVYGGLEALRRADTATGRKTLDRVREEFDRVSRLVVPAVRSVVSRHRTRIADLEDAHARVADVEAAVRAAVEAQAEAMNQGRADLMAALEHAHSARADAEAGLVLLTKELSELRQAARDARAEEQVKMKAALKAVDKAEARRAAEADAFLVALAEIRSENAAAQAQLTSRIEELQGNLAAESRRQSADRLAMQARIDALEGAIGEREERLRQYREAGSGEFLAWAIRRNERP